MAKLLANIIKLVEICNGRAGAEALVGKAIPQLGKVGGALGAAQQLVSNRWRRLPEAIVALVPQHHLVQHAVGVLNHAIGEVRRKQARVGRQVVEPRVAGDDVGFGVGLANVRKHAAQLVAPRPLPRTAQWAHARQVVVEVVRVDDRAVAHDVVEAAKQGPAKKLAIIGRGDVFVGIVLGIHAVRQLHRVAGAHKLFGKRIPAILDLQGHGVGGVAMQHVGEWQREARGDAAGKLKLQGKERARVEHGAPVAVFRRQESGVRSQGSA